MNTEERGRRLPKWLLESYKKAYRESGLPEQIDDEADAMAWEVLSGVALVVELAAKRKEPGPPD